MHFFVLHFNFCPLFISWSGCERCSVLQSICRHKNVNALFYPMLPNFRKGIVVWRLRLRQFVLLPAANRWLRSTVGMIMTLHNRRTRTETCHSATSSIINLTWAGPRRNTGLRGEKPATNCLSHGTDLTRPIDSQSVSAGSRPSWVSRPDLSLKCIFSLGAPFLTAGRVYRFIRHRRCRFTYLHTYIHT